MADAFYMASVACSNGKCILHGHRRLFLRWEWVQHTLVKVDAKGADMVEAPQRRRECGTIVRPPKELGAERCLHLRDQESLEQQLVRLGAVVERGNDLGRENVRTAAIPPSLVPCLRRLDMMMSANAPSVDRRWTTSSTRSGSARSPSSSGVPTQMHS